MKVKFWLYLGFLLILNLPSELLAQEVSVRASDGVVYRLEIPLDNQVGINLSDTLRQGIQTNLGTKATISQQVAAELLGAAQELQHSFAVNYSDSIKTINELSRAKELAVAVNALSSTAVKVLGSSIGATLSGGTTLLAKVSTGDVALDMAEVGARSVKDALIASAVKELADSAATQLSEAERLKTAISTKVSSSAVIDLTDLKKLSVSRSTGQNTVALAVAISKENTESIGGVVFESTLDTVTNAIGVPINAEALKASAKLAKRIDTALIALQAGQDLYAGGDAFTTIANGFQDIKNSVTQQNDYFSPATADGFIKLAQSKGWAISDSEPKQPQIVKEKNTETNKTIGQASADPTEARQQADEAAQKKAEAEAQAAVLQKDLDMMGAEMSSLASKLAKAGSKSSLESSLQKSKKEYDDNLSRQRMLSRQLSTYKEALKQLTGTIKTYEVSINGQVFHPEDISTLNQRISEQSAILAQLKKTFSNPRGLKEQYEAARERLDAYTQVEKQQAEAKVKLAETEAAIAQALADAHAAEEVLKNNQALVAERQATIKATPQDTLSIDQPAAWQPPFDSNETPSTSSSLPSNSPSPQTSIDNYADELREDDFVALTSTSTTTIGAASNSGVGGSVIADDSSSNILAVTFLAGKFRETPLRVNSEYYDIDEIVTAIFGGNYRVADWTEIIPYLIGNANDFIDQWVSGKGTLKNFSSPLLPLTNSSSPPENYRSPMITKQGSLSLGRISSDGDTFNRQYFVDYRDSVGLEAVQTDSNFFSLSAWQTTSSILAIKTNSDPEPAINTAAGPSTYQEWMGFCPYLRVSPSDNGTALANIILGLNPATRTVSHNFAGAGGASTVTDSFYYGKDLLGVAYTSWITGQAGWLVNGADAVATGTFNYLTWGTWNENASYNAATDTIVKVNTLAMPWVAGQLTPSNEIPISGSATYNGSVIGAVGQIGDASSVQRVAGNLTLQADFASQVLSGQFNTMHLQNGDPWKDFNVNASWASGANSINGTITSTDNSTNGTMGGKFYGPNAAELGGAWSSDNGTGELATGIFVGKKQ